MASRRLSDRELDLWRAYLDVLNEPTPLVDRWSNGSVTWHPRVVQKLIWYSGLKNTVRNRWLVHDWLMRRATKAVNGAPLAR
jgi:hypothetical protein